MSRQVLNYFEETSGSDNALNLSGTWKIDGSEVNAAAADLNKTSGMAGNALGTTAAGKQIVVANHTVSAGEATANQAVIATGLTTIASILVQIYRSNVNVMADAVVTFSAGDLTVADGASTYNMTAGDIIRYIAFGV